MDTNGPTLEAIRTLTYLGRLAAKRQELDLGIQAHVDIAREQGASWRMIGAALGCSTQNAWSCYSGRQRDSEIGAQDRLPFED